MKIGIDIDDTMTDSYDIITSAYYYCCNANKDKYKGLSYCEMENRFPNYKDFTIKAFKKIIPYAKLKSNVKEVIDELHNMGYIIEIVTARNTVEYPDPYGISLEYLKKNNIYFDKLNVSVSNKGAFCKENNIDVLIDDSIQNVESAKDYGVKTILFNNIFNKEAVGHIKVNNWLDVLNILKGN